MFDEIDLDISKRIVLQLDTMAAEALRLVSREEFSLYLLNYHLSYGTGIELCLLIKNFDDKTPILFITGISSMTEQQALKIGAQGLIKKNDPQFFEKLTAPSYSLTFSKV